MKYLKTFRESISGTEVLEPFGPAYGRPSFPFTGSKKDTQLSHSGVRRKTNNDLTDDICTIDDYNELYQDYLKCGGKPLPDGYTDENVDKVNQYLSRRSCQ
jgi:hypothetical protein